MSKRRTRKQSKTPSPPSEPNEPMQPPAQSQLLLANQSFSLKSRNAAIRSFWAVIMLALFIGIIRQGPIAVIILTCSIQAFIYREVIQIGVGPAKERDLPWYRSLHW